MGISSIYIDLYNSLLNKEQDDLHGEKTWVHKPSKLEYYHKHPERYGAYYHQRVPIDKLYKDNNLDDLKEWDTPYGRNDNFEYNPDRDNENGINGLIYGVAQPNGKIILDNGRHRIKSLKNAGYTHVNIPIGDSQIIDDPIFSKDFASKNLNDLNQSRKRIKYYGYKPDVYNHYKNELDKKIALYKNLQRILKGRKL